jgi:hypothetical protein
MGRAWYTSRLQAVRATSKNDARRTGCLPLDRLLDMKLWATYPGRWGIWPDRWVPEPITNQSGGRKVNLNI